MFKSRLLYGKCTGTIFIHELRCIGQTNDGAQRSSGFSDTIEQVNKDRTKNFPLRYLFVSLVVRLIAEILLKES